VKHSVFVEAPADFSPRVEAAGCYCEFGDKILFLKRHSTRPQGDTWGVPGGKLEKGESPRSAVIREVQEEVGIEIDGAGLKEVGRLYIRLPEADYVFHLFRNRFESCPEMTLALEEHQEARWVTFSEALQLPLITGGKEALEYYRECIRKKR
jgi:8-oxo-dGTP diphosphatase